MTATMFAQTSSNRSVWEFCSELFVERTDIEFTNRNPDLVDIRIAVRNLGTESSDPTSAVISAAPLGAFVPWRPVALAPVPALAAGKSFVLRTQARRPRSQPLGTPDRVPPNRVLVALGSDDEDRPGRGASASLFSPLLAIRDRRGPSGGTGGDSVALGVLPHDPLALLMRENPHWAGNLNIFIGGRSVERHMAKSLRVYPGRTNMAMFLVGTGRDAYTFDIKGDAAEWESRLFDFTRSQSFRDKRPFVPLNQWIELNGHSMMILAVRPPESASEGSLEVHVKQRSTGQTAVVEFSLDPNADGPGCYVV